jgi:hypothetical protein
LLFKNGRPVVQDGHIIDRPTCLAQTVAPAYDAGIKRSVKWHFDRLYSLKLSQLRSTTAISTALGRRVFATSPGVSPLSRIRIHQIKNRTLQKLMISENTPPACVHSEVA